MRRVASAVHRVLLTVALAAALFAGVLASCSGASAVKSRPPSKVSRELTTLYDAYVDARRSGTPLCPDAPWLRIEDDRVVVDATAAAGDARALEADLVSLGMRHAVAYERVVSGELPIGSIPALNDLETLAFARAAMGSPSSGRASPCAR